MRRRPSAQVIESADLMEDLQMKKYEKYIYIDERKKEGDGGFCRVQIGKTVHYHRTIAEAQEDKERMISIYNYNRDYADRVYGQEEPLLEMPVRKLAEEWYETVKKPSISLNTRKRYDEAVYKAIIPLLGELPLRKLTRTRIQQAVSYLFSNGYPGGQKRGLAVSTVRIICHVLRGFCNYLIVTRGWCVDNPCRNLVYPKGHRERRRALTYEEVEKLMRYIYDHYDIQKYWMFLLYFQSSMRRCELLGMKWDQVHLRDDGSYLVVGNILAWNPDTKRWVDKPDPKTRAGVRQIPISEEMTKYLAKKYLLDTDKHGYIWKNRLKNPFNPKKIDADFHRAVKALGYENVTLHSTRHTWASIMADQGVPMTTTMAVGGWKKATTLLNVYTHSMKSQKSKSDAVLGALKGQKEVAQNLHKKSAQKTCATCADWIRSAK